MLRNLDRLKVFYHVYSHQGITVAAKTMNVTQPAVSQALQKLEQDIEAQLFVRHHKRLIPTAAADRLFATVQPFWTDLEGCLNAIQRGKDQPFGTLRIGSPLEFGKTYFPTIVASFRSLYPDVTLELTLGDQDKLLTRLENGALDFAYVDMYQTQQQYFGDFNAFQIEPITEEEIILGCSRDYYAQVNTQLLSAEVLCGCDFVGYREDLPNVQSWFQHHFDVTRLNIEPTFVINSHQAIVAAIQANLGLGIIASHLVRAQLEAGEIVAIRTGTPEIRNQISLVRWAEKEESLAEKTFQRFFRTQLPWKLD